MTDTNNCIIRTADPDDLLDCHTIEALSFPAGEAAWTTTILHRIETYPEGFLVAEQDGQVVGQINSGSTHRDDISDEEFKQLVGHDPDGRNMVVFSLSVLPEYRNRGVGGRLLTDFIAQAREMGKEQILLLCKEDLVSYYAAHGFNDGGPSESTHGGAPWRVMTLPL